MPWRCSAISSPMLLITVATTRVVRQLLPLLEVEAEQEQHRVAVDDVAAMIDEDRAIAVAVERDAEPAAGGDDLAREPRRVRRAAREIDVAAVGLIRRAARLADPSSVNNAGAVAVVAPLAMSTAIRAPSSTPAVGSSRRR